jgi:PAS domain S-box-containing protein
MLAAHPVLRVGVSSDWEPIEFLDAKGRYQGIISDWMNLVSQQLGVRFEFVAHDSWDQVMTDFYEGKLDVLAALSATPEREARMRFTRPYLNFGVGIITRNDAPYVEKLQDFPSGRLAMVKGFVSSAAALTRAPHLTPVPVDSVEESLMAVSTGRADVTVSTVLVAHYFARQRGLSNLRIGADSDDYPEGLSMAVRPELDALVPTLQAALDSIPLSQRVAINKRWVDVEQINRQVITPGMRLGVFGLFLGLVVMAWLVYAQRRQLVISRQLLHRAEEAEQRLGDIATSAPGVLWQLSRDRQRNLTCVYMSDQAEQTTGVTVQDTLQDIDALMASFHPEDQQRVLQILRTCEPADGQQEYRHRLRTRGGRWLAIQVTFAVQRHIDGSIRITGFSRDVSHQQALETALDASQKRLHDLAEGVPGALWQFRREADGHQHYSFMSDGIVHITGRTPQETNQLMQDKSFVTVYPDDLDIVRSLMDRLTQRPGIQEARYRLCTADGGTRWVQVAARAMPPEPDGALVWNGITLDATRMQETEEALRGERQKMQDLADSFEGVIWRMSRDAQGAPHFDYISQGVTKLMGYAPEAFLSGQPEAQIGRAHV